MSYPKSKNQRQRENLKGSQKEEKTLPTEEQGQGLPSDFCSENIQAKREQPEILNVQRKGLPTQNSRIQKNYPSKVKKK